MDELRELAELVNEHGFTDFEFENENIRVRLSKMTATPVMQAVQPVAAAPAAAPVQSAGAAAPSNEGSVESPSNLHILKSPIVGTYYSAPSPDASPYVGVGTRVKKGQTLCIIEAMKLMNEIESDVDGVIAEILPENGQAVEYGQPLFGIEVD